MAHKIALVGNPNCGKTTLFNQLTGSNQYVGNWPGVTVEKKEGRVRYGDSGLDLVDLPGIYSLSPYSMEEVVTRDYIIREQPEVIINIIDGTNIERNLYLSVQLMELGRPVVMAINMMDDVQAKGDRIYTYRLARMLGFPVIPIVARRGENIHDLLHEVEKMAHHPVSSGDKLRYDEITELALEQIGSAAGKSIARAGYPPRYGAVKLLEGEEPEGLRLTAAQREKVEAAARAYESASRYGDRETMVADARYNYIAGLVKGAVKKNQTPGRMTTSDKIDRVVTSRLLALPIFLLLMFLMFSVTFGPVGEGLKAWAEGLIAACSGFIEHLLAAADAPGWTYGLILDAVIGGVGGILSFLPQIMLLFLFLSLLEDTGYMSRAAFIMDRLLRKLGLSGKSFIPMLMGFGCTTPAVMAARTMENEKDRRLTIMLTPFMSCGAKLPIYGLFTAAFFPSHKGLVVFSMYITGMVVAVVCGILLKHTLFRGDDAPFVMELPAYRWPTLQSTLLHLWDKCKGFLIKAGTIIFSMSIITWLLQTFTPALTLAADNSESIFAAIGEFIAPVFVPLGFGTWQAATALLTGLIAKETVVATMGVLYGGGGLSLTAAVAGVFTPLSALSFMVFCLLYMPCIAAFVAIKKEMNSLKWALGTMCLQFAAAYLVSLLVYQIGGLFI